MIEFTRGLRSALLSTTDQKRLKRWLKTCDQPGNPLYQLNACFNTPWHMGGLDYLGTTPEMFLKKLAHSARNASSCVAIQGTIHNGDTHPSALFPGHLVQDSYVRCVFDDGQIYHLIVDAPVVVA